MSKRCDKFEKADRNYYPTPPAGVDPLTFHLTDVPFVEPCVGDGRLAGYLETLGFECVGTNDIHPQIDREAYPDLAESDTGFDMTDPRAVEDYLAVTHLFSDDFIWITNPPWPDKSRTGAPVTPMIDALTKWRDCWMLLPADFAHNQYAEPYIARCRKIVSVGRVKWIEGSKNSGVDNAAWYLFTAEKTGGPTFYGQRTGRSMSPLIESIL